MSTTLIRDGTIIDGGGGASYEGHVLIEGDKIGAVIKKGEEPPRADEEIDASCCVISPGFIDMHSHADWIVPQDNHPDLMKCLIEQGVTTVVAGNCGFSPAPVRAETLKLLDESLVSTLIDEHFDYNWSSMGEFLDNIEESKPVLNIAELVGHGTIRLKAADTRRGAMKPDKLKACCDELRRSLDEGACGLSFGLGYDPGMYSPLEELEAFMQVAAEAEKPVTVHLKALSWISPTYPYTSLKAHNIRALEEMLDLARKTGAKLQISHFIFVGRRSFRTAEPSIKLVEKARSDGVDVMVDAFPYTCGNTTVNVVMPYWFLKNLPGNYRSKTARARLRAELELGFRVVGFIYKDFQVMDAGYEGGEEINGLTIVEIARKWGTSPFKAMLKLSETTNGGALMLFHGYSGEAGNEGPLEAVLSHDLCLFETDALIKSRGYPNPAAIGTFPRILGKYVREKKMFGVENALHRMTGASAARLGFKDRGILKKGNAADITVFDPKTIIDDPPEGKKPAGPPTGIKQVFINGEQVLKDGVYVGASRPGRVLRI